MNKRSRNILFWLISIIILLVIGIITAKVINQTENPSLFDIDFDKKEHIITSYSTLVGVLLTFLSFIYVIYTIIQQKEQYDNDKLEEKEKEKNALFDRMKLVNNLLKEIIGHISDTGKEMEAFFIEEKKSPLKNNQMSFYTNRNYYRLLELDYLSIFNSFQEYSSDDDKTKSFNTLYKIVDFYSESIVEQKEKYQYHIKNKFERKLKIADELNLVMDNASKILEDYKIDFTENEDYKNNKWYQLLNGLIAFYYERIPRNDEANYEKLDKEVLLLFLEEANKIRKDIGFEKKIQDLVLQISGIRKQLYSIKMESINFGEQMEKRFNNYYSTKSTVFIDLVELSEQIKSLVNPVTHLKGKRMQRSGETF